MDEDEYIKLPLEDRCIHKVWKARVHGYEECTKLFPTWDEKSQDFLKFAPLMKKFVTDSNAVAQEKALDAVLVFVENAHVAGRTAGEVTAGIVTKCLSAPKKPTQEKALEVLLMYCEIEKYEPVEEELIKGFAQKNPKVVCGCIKAVSTALREFGSKVIAIKPLVKSMSALLEDRDKNVREETKKMVIEMYRWAGAALKPQLTSLKPIQVQELEAEFEKMPKEKPVQTRYLKSQQEQKAKVEATVEGEVEPDNVEEEGPEDFDPMDLMSAVNILEKLPKDFFEKVEAKKWQERKEMMEVLLPLSQSPKLESGEYAELVRALKKIVAKDSNVMIVALAGQCMAGLAKGLKKKFSPFAVACIETILEKFKEKKINVVNALREAADAIFQSTSIEAIQEIVSGALKNKNPNVKAETATFLARAFCWCTPQMLPKKLLKIYVTDLLKTLNESDATVREGSAEALGSALKVVSEKVMLPFLADVDALKMQKIKEFSEKAEIKVKIKQTKPKPAPKAAPKDPPAIRGGARPPGKGNDPAKRPKAAPARATKPAAKVKKPVFEDDFDFDEGNNNEFDNGLDPCDDASASASDNLSRTNIAHLITETLIAELADKNWKVRIEALGKISSILNSNTSISSDLGELPNALCSRLSDTNKNISAETVKLIGALATALGVQCKPHTRVIVPAILSVMGDVKKNIREGAVCALNTWCEQLRSVKDIIDGEMCIDALKGGSPIAKSELITWMAEKMNDTPPRTLNKDELNGCVDFIYFGLEDRSADIRRASSEAVLPFMLHLGFDAMMKHTSKVKPASKNTVMQALEKAKPNLPARPATGPAVGRGKPQGGSGARPQSGPPDPSRGAAAGGPKAVKRIGVGARAQSATKAGSKKEEDVDSSPLLQENNTKQQRITEEQRMKTLRWDFATPRPEFVTQLKDQMTNANMNRQLFTNMFHQDFRFHIKAIDCLIEDLNDNIDACICNLDLVLRWLTIRFFDTNPSVILKAMDYLSKLFGFLTQQEYALLDYEAYSFMPFLIMKFGDPKDAIRSPTRNIIKLICDIYPASKVSPYVLEGVKSKNARQRGECLETMGSLLEGYGMCVCQPSAPAALKEVAKQIADRDNAVRNAALNCLLQVYFRQGEKVFKLIGQISDKDHSLLEERIKRSAKSKPIIKKPSASDCSVPTVKGAGAGDSNLPPAPVGLGSRLNRVNPVPAAQPAPILRDKKVSAAVLNENSNCGLKRFGQRPLSTEIGSNANSRLKIDYDFFERLLADDVTTTDRPTAYQLEEIPDMDSVLEYQSPIPTSRLTRPALSSTTRANIANANVEFEDVSQAINMVVSQVATPEVNTVITALSQLDEVIQSSEKRHMLLPHIDQLLIVARFQYRHVLNTKMSDAAVNRDECVRIYRSLTSCLMSIFNSPELSSRASRDVLRDALHTVIRVLLDPRLSGSDDGARVVRALNVLVVRIIEKADFTNVCSALLKLLHESVGTNENAKFTELVMKCNWKAIRIMPDRNKELNPVQILQDVHEFMMAYPSNTWSDRPSSTPLRTIKTVLHTLVKVYGTEVRTFLAQVPNSEDSELQRYVIRDLNTMQRSTGSEDGKDNNKLGVDCDLATGKSPKKLSKTANNTLSEIFRIIGSKENTKEGLVQLYEFQQKNPDADIDSYLRKSSQFFQNYIKSNLSRIERERKGESKMATSASSEGSIDTAPLSSIQVSEPTSVNVNELVDQFKAIAAQVGYDNTYIDTAVKEILVDKNKDYSSKSVSSSGRQD